jgi:hypothetical protein
LASGPGVVSGVGLAIESFSHAWLVIRIRLP